MRKPPPIYPRSNRGLTLAHAACIALSIALLIVAFVVTVAGCKTKTGTALEASQKQVKQLKEELDQCRKRHEDKAVSCCDTKKTSEDGKKKPTSPTKLAPLLPDEGKTSAAPKTKSAPAGTRVVIVSVDGFHTGLVPEMWRFRKLQKNASWTLTAQTTYPSTTTVAHASMFTGMDPSTHGVKGEAPKDPVKLAHWHPLKSKTIFQMVDKAAFRPTSLVQKKKLENLFPISAAGLARLDRSLRESSLIDTACSEIRDPEGSRLIFIHLKRLDHVGHTKGWMTTAQKKAAKHIDKALGDLSGCIGEGQKGDAPAITLIVTADHGGHKKTHGTKKPSDKNIPWLIIGPGVKPGHEIKGEVHVKDTAPTALYFLGVDRSDKGFQGKMPEEILE